MKAEYLYRINGFDQIKAFYSWLFNNQDKEINTSHVSLYLFLVNQNNRSNWVEWFKCPYDLGMAGSCIGSRNTYYKCLDDLRDWGLIDYQKGINNYKAPLIKLCLFKNEQLIEQVPIPLSEPLIEPLTIPLTEPLTEHIYKLLTNNLKRITDNIEGVVKYLNSIEKPQEEKADWRNDYKIYLSECNTAYKSFLQNSEQLQIQQRLNPGVNIKLSIEKGYRNFWGTEAGWKYKKKSRSKTIDWQATIIKSIDINKVYYTKEELNNRSSEISNGAIVKIQTTPIDEIR